jgi:hypothetical protein
MNASEAALASPVQRQRLDFHEVQRILPYKSPWLLIDRVDSWDDKEIKVIKAISGSEANMQAHMADGPSIMPGVLQIELVNQALMLLMILQNMAGFVVADGFKHVVPMYLKLGFVLQYPKNDPRHAVRMSHGYICYPVVMDFRSMVLDRAGGQNYTSEYSGETSRYLAERWFKRYLVNHMWRRLLGRHEINGIAEIKEVLLPRIPVRCT